MRIVVTGARGFIGRNVVAALQDQGVEIAAVSRRTDYAVPGCETIVGDLSDPEFAVRAVEGAAHVVHCAAETRNPTAMHDSNVVATENLVSAAQRAGIRRFVHLSSVGVIGYTKQQVIDEDTPCRPMNLYEETKLEAEEVVANSNLSGCILRPTNVFGEENIDVWTRSGRMKQWVLGGENANLVYAGDVVAAIIFALCRETAGMETFIVSSDDEAGNTKSDLFAFCHNRPKRRGAPVFLPSLARVLVGRGGPSNFGNKIYSPKRILDAGFSRPFGLAEGLRVSLDSYRW